MKHYRLNQIAMAVLGALLLFFGTRTLINIAFEEHEPEKPGLEVAGTEEKPEEAKPGDKPAAAGSEVLALLATADPAQGEADAALCKVCHTFEAGGAAMIGPNLHNVVGRNIASVEGFNYTPALKGKEGDWTYEEIDAFITNPQVFAPGTMMAFPGVPDVKKRANIIAFLRSQTDNPPPLPEAAATPAEAAPEASEPEAPAPVEEAPAPAEEAPPPEPEAPAAEPEPTAAAEEPAAEPEPAEAPAPTEEATPSAGEEPNPSWPQPVYPGEPAEPAEGPAPSASEAPSPSAPSPSGETPNPSWPQPVYPDGPPN
ncbi:MAG: c-type cytochrome [Methyloceanibacter sp.]